MTPSFAQTCTLHFDTSCPTVAPECGATFSGGQGCVSASMGNCYHLGIRAYQVTTPDTLTVTLDPPISEILVFFAHTGGVIGPIGVNMVSNGTPVVLIR